MSITIFSFLDAVLAVVGVALVRQLLKRDGSPLNVEYLIKAKKAKQDKDVDAVQHCTELPTCISVQIVVVRPLLLLGAGSSCAARSVMIIRRTANLKSRRENVLFSCCIVKCLQ